MDAFGRVLLRFLVVPVGALIAVTVGIIVLIVAEWNAFVEFTRTAPNGEFAAIALLMLAPFALMIIAGSAIMVLSPMAIGILIAEFFAIRSWLFHVGNGVASAWIGWTLSDPPRDQSQFFADPKLIVAMGLMAGLAYWLVAGWNAGLWRSHASEAGAV